MTFLRRGIHPAIGLHKYGVWMITMMGRAGRPGGAAVKSTIPMMLFLAACGAHKMEVRSPEDSTVRVLSASRSALGPTEMLMFKGTALFRRSDSTLVVSDAKSIHEFDEETGRPIRSFGARGQDPGEFEVITWAGIVAGDTIAVVDSGLHRLTYIAPNFGLRIEKPSPIESGILEPRCVLRNGSKVSTLISRSSLPQRVVVGGQAQMVNPVGIHPYILRIEGRDGGEAQVLDSIVAAPRWVGTVHTDEGSVSIGFPVPLASSSFVRCDGDAVLWGNASEPLVQRYLNGSVEAIPLLQMQGHPIQESSIRNAVDSAVVGTVIPFGSRASAEESLKAIFEEALRAQTSPLYPYFVDLRVAEDGSIWTLLPHISGRASDGIGGTKIWRSFSPKGDPLGEVEVPADFELLLITEDGLWGVAPGPFGDPHVVREDRFL